MITTPSSNQVLDTDYFQQIVAELTAIRSLFNNLQISSQNKLWNGTNYNDVTFSKTIIHTAVLDFGNQTLTNATTSQVFNFPTTYKNIPIVIATPVVATSSTASLPIIFISSTQTNQCYVNISYPVTGTTTKPTSLSVNVIAIGEVS